MVLFICGVRVVVGFRYSFRCGFCLLGGDRVVDVAVSVGRVISVRVFFLIVIVICLFSGFCVLFFVFVFV